MNIAVACGGTGGHIFPGLATAEELMARGHEVTLWLAGKGTESAALASWTGPKVKLEAAGFESRLNLRALGIAWSLWRAGADGKRIMRERPPSVLLAMGSYASVGPILAALRLKVPVVLHEANVIPGRAIRLFSRRAAAVAISFEGTSYYLKRAKLELTGMPIRRDLLVAAATQPERSFNANTATLLVMGGSAGAERLNREVPPAVIQAAKSFHGLRVIHLTGRGREEPVAEAYRAAGIAADVRPFAQNMAEIYMASDFAVCRSGAATCAELSVFGLPALLVPYPHAVANHQWANAEAMGKAGAADLVADADLTAGWLLEYLLARLHDPRKREQMSRASRARAQHRAARALADLVERCAK